MYQHDSFPIFDSRKQRPRADDILKPGPKLFQGCPDDLEAPPGLCRRIAAADGLTIRSYWSGSADCDQAAGADSA
jgi:hypothetical protein